MTTKYVYFFGNGKADGKSEMRNLLGGKGANLAEMTNIGLPVPAGFTLSTDVCTYYYAHGRQYPPELKQQVETALRQVEETMGTKFGDPKNPMLLACRSGARDSMPGMMDTVLNIGLNDDTVQALIKQSGNERFALDSYRRLLLMYGEVVMGLKGHKDEPFEHILEQAKHKQGVQLDNELSVESLRGIIKDYKAAIKKYTGKDFPSDPHEQMWNAIGAVFGSWMNDRACVYRRQYGIPDEWGTACNIMAMVFGNLGDDCATGVALTRDGSLGAPGMNGDYLINAQGEDVVNGSRPTKRIEETLGKDMPAAYKELVEVGHKLEKHYRNMQDIEFTISRNKLYMLQTRNAKRTGFAAVRVATDLVEEGLITKEDAISSKFIPAGDLSQLLQPLFDAEAKKKASKEGKLLTKGIPAGPGAATGKIVCSPQKAEAMKAANPNEALVLVRKETTPEDLRGMKAALGILTAVGGVSSHAALVSRQMGKVCIVGAGELDIDNNAGTVKVKGQTFKEGDDISIDGFTGEVFTGRISTKPSEVVQVLIKKELPPEKSDVYRRFKLVMDWADEYRKLKVRTNADLPDQAAEAIAFGAEGIGLCRTEHMFFDHIAEMREMIMATDLASREKALAKMLPFQRNDFAGLFRAMAGKPVTIRLLDPPLHEFLPQNKAGQEEMAKILGTTVDAVARRVHELHEANPMLGHRGCRLGIVYPEITAMQARAIFEAAVQVQKEGVKVLPEVMIPLVGFKKELTHQEKIVRETADKVFAETSTKVEYMVGTMIEVPRACVTADAIAQSAEFFSFGTNDLTQTTLGMSRDDYGPFISAYTDPKKADVIASDPFATIDQDGIGGLMKIGVEKGRATRPDLKIGICGEHGGDPDSVKFCHKIGLNYVSCSPFRVPVARLAAAQAALGK
ncbi:MAG: pyruvate, phosphate dikinase [Planctomycetia bacterium]|nr:pyruvate, phosphate dikinase [Planctomycetia bacterium]